jgi:hypothetical protein
MSVASTIRALDKLKGARAFNQFAHDKLVDDNREALQLAAVNLAARQRNWRRGRVRYGRELSPTDRKLSAEITHIGTLAGIAFANAWIGEGDFYHNCGKAISNAMDEWLRAGHGRHDNTWRGPYSTDARKFSSQLSESLLTHNAELVDTDNAEPEYIDEEGARDKLADRVTDAGVKATREEHDSHAEIISHTAGDDSERLDPKADPDKSFGIEGATRGVGTGTLRPSAFDMMYLAACERLRTEYPKVWDIVDAVDRDRGGEDRYIAQGRQHRRSEILQTLAFADSKIREWRDDMLAQYQLHDIEAVYEPAPDPTMAPKIVPRRVRPLEPVWNPRQFNKGLSWGAKGFIWQPEIVHRGIFTFTISGLDRASMRRAVKRWQHFQAQWDKPKGAGAVHEAIFSRALEASKKR